MRKKQCVFLFTKDWRVIYGLWEVSRAWLGLMQSILIFITPTSCAYDILDLPWYAKSSLSLLLSLTPILPLPLPLSHRLSGSLSGCPSSPSIELKGHITLTACVNSVSSSISLSAGRRSRKICQGQCEEAMALPHLAKVMLWEHKNGFVNIFHLLISWCRGPQYKELFIIDSHSDFNMWAVGHTKNQIFIYAEILVKSH